MRLLFISILLILPMTSFSAGTDTIEITICESGCDYTSLDVALAGEARSLVTADSSILFKITGTWDNSDDVRARVIGFTTDPTRTITIRAEGDAAVSGTWSTTAYRLHAKGANSGYYGAISIDDGGENIQIYDLQLKIDTSRASDAVINFGYLVFTTDSMVVRISGCLLWHYDDANNSKKYINEGGEPDGYNRVWNNMMWGLPNNGSVTNRGIESKVHGYYYNNTMHDGHTAFADLGVANDALLYNNIVAGDFTAFESGDWSASSDYNATTLGTAMGGGNDRVSQTFTFTDTANDDFHLELSDAGARDYGKDLSADGNLSFSDDIDNQSRPYSTIWDIGADEYRYSIVVESYTSNNSGTAETDSVMLGKPFGVQVGDLLLLIAGNDYNGLVSAFEEITGWTRFINIGDNNTDCKLACYWRIATGAEGDSIKVTTTEGLTDEMWGWYIRISNADETTPINNVGTGVWNASASTHKITQATSDVDSCLVIYALSFDGGDGYPFSESDAGWVEEDEQQAGTTGNDASGCWGVKTLASQGGAGTVTITSTVGDGAVGIQFAIAPFTEAPAAEGKFIMIQQ